MFAYLADRPYAADAEGLYLRELTGVEDKAMALGCVIKLFKFVSGMRWRVRTKWVLRP